MKVNVQRRKGNSCLGRCFQWSVFGLFRDCGPWGMDHWPVQRPKRTTLNHGSPKCFCMKPPVKPTLWLCGSAQDWLSRGFSGGFCAVNHCFLSNYVLQICLFCVRDTVLGTNVLIWCWCWGKNDLGIGWFYKCHFNFLYQEKQVLVIFIIVSFTPSEPFFQIKKNIQSNHWACISNCPVSRPLKGALWSLGH